MRRVKIMLFSMHIITTITSFLVTSFCCYVHSTGQLPVTTCSWTSLITSRISSIYSWKQLKRISHSLHHTGYCSFCNQCSDSLATLSRTGRSDLRDNGILKCCAYVFQFASSCFLNKNILSTISTFLFVIRQPVYRK